MTDKTKRNFFSALFIPEYDELGLFCMSYVLILLVLFNASATTIDFSSWGEDPGIIFILIAFLTGMGLCIFHAFSRRKKSRTEKRLMILFAAILNGFCGIWYGTYILVHTPGYALAVFPVWNIISGYILIASLRSHSGFDQRIISDENISLKKLIVNSIIVTALFLICQVYFQLVWAATFSICMVWITNLNKAVDATLLKLDILSD